MTEKYNKGKMPRTDFKYEEFESNILGTFYKSLKSLKNGDEEDRKNFEYINNVLEEIAEKYNVQTPENAANNPRTNEEWAQPTKNGIGRLLASLTFVGVRSYGNWAGEYMNRLGIKLLEIFDKYGVKSKFEKDENGKIISAEIIDRKKDTINLETLMN